MKLFKGFFDFREPLLLSAISVIKESEFIESIGLMDIEVYLMLGHPQGLVHQGSLLNWTGQNELGHYKLIKKSWKQLGLNEVVCLPT